MRFAVVVFMALLCSVSAAVAQGQGQAAAPEAAERRVALVIGNSSYKHTTPLTNPRNDASDVAGMLRSVGFEVIEGRDLDKASMDRTIRDFAEALNGAAAALFFYAGHGLQVSGKNYLVPTDARLSTAAALDFEMVRLDLIHSSMEREARTNIIILDACRDNPLSRNLARALGTRSAAIGRGLAAVESGEGTLISFSTQPGNVALDGHGRNSPFVEALVRRIPGSNDDIAAVLIDVRNDVMQATARKQVPWEHSALTARFYFRPPKPVPTAPTAEQQLEMLYWSTVKDSTNPSVLRTYLEKFPDGTFVPLAQALIEQYEKRAQMEKAARIEEQKRAEAERRRIEEVKRQEEVQRLAAAQRLEEVKRTDEQKRVETARDAAAQKQLAEQRKASEEKRAEELRKAVEDAKQARAAAQAAELQREAALKAADDAKKALETSQKEAARAIKDIEEKPISKEAKLAALPNPEKPEPPSRKGFDGDWIVQQHGNSGCFRPSARWLAQIKGGSVRAKFNGTVSESGSFRYRGRADNGREMIYTGTLRGNSGNGTYYVVGGKCSGTFTMVRK